MMQNNKNTMPVDDLSFASRMEVYFNGGARRFIFYFAALFTGICIFAFPLGKLIMLSLDSELYSFIPLIFATSAYLLVTERKEIFDKPVFSPVYGALFLVLSLAAGAGGLANAVSLSPNDYLCVMAFSFWLYVVGSFMLCFGVNIFMKALFPLGLLLFTVPFPDLILGRMVDFLQVASCDVTGWIFNALGFFPLREGFSFRFPEVSIEVAKQCSGIRSSTALVILSLLCGDLFLRSCISRILLVICSVFIAIFKNGVRIVVLTLGSIYVDPRILSSDLHRKGGIPIFIMAFAMLTSVVLIMRKLERLRKTS